MDSGPVRAAAHVLQGAGYDVKQIASSLGSVVGSTVASTWSGAGATGFQHEWQQTHESLTQMSNGLEEAGRQFATVADKIDHINHIKSLMTAAEVVVGGGLLLSVFTLGGSDVAAGAAAAEVGADGALIAEGEAAIGAAVNGILDSTMATVNRVLAVFAKQFTTRMIAEHFVGGAITGGVVNLGEDFAFNHGHVNWTQVGVSSLAQGVAETVFPIHSMSATSTKTWIANGMTFGAVTSTIDQVQQHGIHTAQYNWNSMGENVAESGAINGAFSGAIGVGTAWFPKIQSAAQSGASFVTPGFEFQPPQIMRTVVGK